MKVKIEWSTALTASNYIKFEDSSNADILIVAFSHVGYPETKFAFSNAISHLDCKKLFINCPENSWYQSGIPGIGVTIQDSADALSALITKINAKKTIFIGMSMGGYAAILFGLLCKASIILSFTAEIILGGSTSRSFKENKLRIYDPKFSNLSSLIYTNATSLIFLVYGEDDLIDLSLLWPISLQITERKKLHFFLSEGAHQCTLELNIPLILKTLMIDGWLGNKSFHPTRIRDYTFQVEEFFLYSTIKNLLDNHKNHAAVEMINQFPLIKSRKNLIKLRDSITSEA